MYAATDAADQPTDGDDDDGTFPQKRTMTHTRPRIIITAPPYILGWSTAELLNRTDAADDDDRVGIGWCVSMPLVGIFFLYLGRCDYMV